MAEQRKEKMYNNYIMAMTISERFNAFKKAKYNICEDITLIDTKWFNVRTLMNRKLFEAMIKLMGITKEEFAFLIKEYNQYEKDILYHSLKMQDWYKVFISLIANYRRNYSIKACEQNQFVIPFFYYIQNNLKSIKTKKLYISSDVKEKLVESIILQIESLAWKCIIQEFDEYRRDANENQDKNIKDSSYKLFIRNKMHTPRDLFLFYAKYPVLARIMTQKMLNILQYCNEVISNLDKNFGEINQKVKIDNNIIVSMEIALGDTHKKGRTVAIIEFKNGKKLVYKPRDGRLQEGFNKFVLDIVTRKKELMDFYINPAYYGNDFLVEQFVVHKECKTKNEVKAYYYRYGELLAIVGLLHGSDIHSENLIAHADYPVIIDLETMFSVDNIGNQIINGGKVYNKELFSLEYSGMLPMQGLQNNVSNKGIDISALTGGEQIELPNKQLVIKDLYQDSMRYEYEFVQKKEDKNKPVLCGARQEFHNYKKEILKGFYETLVWINDNKKEVFEEIIECFGNSRIRVVAKSTCIYADLLSYANHPTYLRNMIYLERLFDNSFIYPHKDKRIILCEIEDLLNFEIPIFYADIRHTYLVSSTGEILDNFYTESPLENVCRIKNRLERATIEHEFEKEQILLGDYLKLAQNRMNKLRLLPTVNEENCMFDRCEILDVCKQIAEDIMNAAIETGESILWRSVNTMMGDYPLIVWMNDSLYNGKYGIWWYYYQLNRCCNDKRMKRFSEHLLEDIEKGQYMQSENIYEKEGAELYFRNNIGVNIDESLERVINRIYAYKITDKAAWIDGISGYGIVLSRIYEKDRSNTRIRKCLEYIGSELKKINSYKIAQDTSLGLAHGAIGVLLLAHIIEKLLGISLNKLIENLYDAIDKTLATLIDHPMDNSWCRGTVGLGLGAIECKKYADNRKLDAYIDIAEKNVLKNIPTNMCLCHGLSGDIELLIQLIRLNPSESLKEALNKRVNLLIHFYKKYHCAILLETEKYKEYSLFTGLAGIGYELLRIIYSDVPNILIFE